MSKRFKIVLCIASVLLILALLLDVIVLMLPNDQSSNGTVSTMGYGNVSEPTELSGSEKFSGSASVLDYGANPTDDKDDTDAFEKAIQKNISVYVPAGTYYISRPIALNDQNVFGDGDNASFIIGTIPDKNAPILYLGGSSMATSLSISYDAKLITGKEKRGERVAISCGAAVAFGPGGGVRNITVDTVGTAIFSDNFDGFGSNNCTYENIIINNVSFRGFDFKVASGYGNIFRQIEVSNSKANAAFYFEGFGGVDQVEQITVDNCNLQYAIGYTELSGVTIEHLNTKDCQFAIEAKACVEE